VERRAAAPGRAIHFEQSVRGYFDVIPAPSGTKDRIGECRLVNAVLDEGFVNVNCDNLAENEPSFYGLTLSILKLDDLSNLAFHRRATFAHTGNVNMTARCSCQSRTLIHLHRAAAEPRSCSSGRPTPWSPGSRRTPVFPTRSGHCLSRNGSKSQDRRIIIERIEEAIGRQVELPLRVSRGNPADRTRRNDSVEGVVPESMPLKRLVVVNVLGIHSNTPPRGWLILNENRPRFTIL
jgi:hypothetical protein